MTEITELENFCDSGKIGEKSAIGAKLLYPHSTGLIEPRGLSCFAVFHFCSDFMMHICWHKASQSSCKPKPFSVLTAQRLPLTPARYIVESQAHPVPYFQTPLHLHLESRGCSCAPASSHVTSKTLVCLSNHLRHFRTTDEERVMFRRPFLSSADNRACRTRVPSTTTSIDYPEPRK